MFIFAIVLMLASSIFESFYIENLGYAFLAAIMISFLNASLKPLLTFLTLPITIMSLGILYPIVNVIIIKLAALLLGSHFTVSGIIIPFFVAIFISIMKFFADKLIIEPIIARTNF
jgi:putative membrane protein